MNADEAVYLAEDILEEFRLTGWTVALDNSVARFGVCRYRTKTISLSRRIVELNDEAEVEDTIRHEVAHALAGSDAGHGPEWRAACLRTGARPFRCYDSSAIVTPVPRWHLICPEHGVIATRHRRSRGVYACRRCGRHLRWESLYD